MSSTGRGRLIRATAPLGPGLAALRPSLANPGSADTAAAITNDYWWGTGTAEPLAPVRIPVCWLSMPVTLRMEPPANDATVDRRDASPAYAKNRASLAEFGSYPFTATLVTTTSADASNLAAWVVAYRSQPRTSSPSLTIDLLYRTDTEKRLILGITIGRRIQITGVPAEFPEGASSLIVTGIQHTLGVAVRRVTLTTDPVPGVEPGTPGPWFYLDSSTLDGTDVVPY